MGTFFKGWRRKVGCAALVMALAIMPAYYRSYSLCDSVYATFATQRHEIVSLRGQLVWISSAFRLRRSASYDVRLRPSASYDFRTRRLVCGDNVRPIREVLPQLSVSASFSRAEIRFMPYWCPVLFLTLLSAYLLLWKPRTKPKEQPNA